MKNTFFSIFIAVCLLVYLLTRAGAVSAHSGGAPYIKINGEYSEENPIREVTITTALTLGEDIASGSAIVVGDPVVFEIDERLFPNPYAQAQSSFDLPVTNQQISAAPLFRWDFKDGTDKQDGKRIIHTFTKPGTYIVDLDAKFPGNTQDYESVNTIQLTVVPSKDYELPQAVIAVNNRRVDDPRVDIVSIQPMTRVTFDASLSVGKIAKYQWVFSDGKVSTKETITHRFNRGTYFPTAVVRVTDENGIISDSYVLLNMPAQSLNPVVSLYFKITDYISNVFYKE